MAGGTAPKFQKLFTPLTIRGVEIRNRILSTGHQTLLAHDGMIGPDLIAYHEARAKGGVGLIVTEAARFHESAMSDGQELLAHTDSCIEGYAKLAEAVHRQGARIFAQLSHAGRCSKRMQGGLRSPVFAPSSIPDQRFHTMPRAMPTAMVEEIIDACGAAAGRFAKAGLDGVELSVSHGLLFAQFLNPETNLRSDRYGGSFENRLRPLAEALAAARQAMGEERVVGIRISVEEVEHGGLEQAHVSEVVTALKDQGLIDYVSTTIGSMAGLGGSVHVVPPMEIEQGYVAPKAQALRKAVGLPVFVAGRINQPQIAERILADGMADVCGMTRAMIADEAMPAKARDGKLDDIRACIGCNQACIGHFHNGVSISCIQHPVSGRERRYGTIEKAPQAKRILIAGGGPAGMKAAVTAARRGHQVQLLEKGSRLGGQALLAQLLPGRAEFGGLITNLESELARLGVEARTNAAVDRAVIEREAPDAVILATGALPYWPPIEGKEDAHILDAWQVLNGQANTGSRVLVADWRCDWVGMGLAEKLALEGCHVRLAVNGLHAGQEIQPYLRDHWAGKLHRLGVEVIPYARLFGADGDTAYLLHSVTGDAILCEEVDTIVLAQGGTPCTELEDALEDLRIDLHLAGDCLSPRSAEEAVYEGMQAGLAV